MLKQPKRLTECCPSTLEGAYPANLGTKAKVFKALGDEGRLKVLHLLRDREVCVCDLVETLGMPQGTLSHHLSVLQQAGLVSARKEGRWNYYQVTALATAPMTVFEEP